jgi:predicted amidophosphoribosyltransferase
MAAHLAAALIGLPERVVVVPVAAHPTRSRARGFDHAERLARALGRRAGLPVEPCLRRCAGGRRQVGAGRRERLARSVSDVQVRGRAPERVLLVDDVHTTGGTLRTCARALLSSGSTWIGAATYARTIADSRDAAADKCRSQG